MQAYIYLVRGYIKMIDPNLLMPLIQSMNKGGGNNDAMSQLAPLLGMLNKTPPNNVTQTDNSAAKPAGNNDLMNMLPLLMQMMNKNNNNTANKTEPVIEDKPKSDPFEPIKNIGNDSINSILYNLMNRKV